MKLEMERFGLSPSKLLITAAMCAVGLLSLIFVRLFDNELYNYFYCLATVGFALLPLGLSVIFRWNMNVLFYTFFSLYTLGPLIGAVYKLYYVTDWWDDLLHAMAGTVFAVIGAYLAHSLNRGEKVSYLLSALFGVMVSVTIAVFWEFYEFSSDMLLHSDMQSDTVINIIGTKINRTDGGVDIFKDIRQTLVNGQSLGVEGFLDIGLIDTMTDLFVETVGAVLYLVYAVIDRGRHPLITRCARRQA